MLSTEGIRNIRKKIEETKDLGVTAISLHLLQPTYSSPEIGRLVAFFDLHTAGRTFS